MMAPSQVYYRVNGKIIFNDLLAKYESYRSGTPVEFYHFTDAYDKLDWTVEPTQTMDELMDSYAVHIRNSHERVILSYSGGTDSHTIYKVFERNHLHIDEIMVWENERYEPWHPMAPLTWLKNNHKDPSTKITCMSRFNPELKPKTIRHEDWVLENQTQITKFVIGAGIFDSIVSDYLTQHYGKFTWTLVNGYEQPRVYMKNGKYHSCYISLDMLGLIGAIGCTCFFSEPVIALKQSHLIKRLLQQMQLRGSYSQETSDSWGFKMNRHFSRKSPAHYQVWQKNIGRVLESTPGVSYDQKTREVKFDNAPVVPNKIDGKLLRDWDPGLALLLDQGNSVAKLFERGLRNLLLERDFCLHLQQDDANKSVIAKSAGYLVASKSYCLEK